MSLGRQEAPRDKDIEVERSLVRPGGRGEGECRDLAVSLSCEEGLGVDLGLGGPARWRGVAGKAIRRNGIFVCFD